MISKSISSLQPEEPRYQMISHGNEIIILDTFTGDYYSKYNATNDGPTGWTKVENPFESEE